MSPAPSTRLVALGASNLTRLALALLDAARDFAHRPIEAHMALGRGRSFGIRSRLLGRELPGIDGCRLWQELAASPPKPTTALLTDVGNDVLYGIEVPRILAWVDAALERLTVHAQHRHVVSLPMATLRLLSPRRFTVMRSMLVPSCRLSLPQTLDAAERLHQGLEQLAARHGATFHMPEPAWYGFDPVHVRRRYWGAAARSWLGEVGSSEPMPSLDGTFARLRFLFATPAERAWFGVTRHCEQPARRFADGTTLALW
ncbi:MAG: hypothetical protein ABIP94_17465 [Planctomycetota bacterium]